MSYKHLNISFLLSFSVYFLFEIVDETMKMERETDDEMVELRLGHS